MKTLLMLLLVELIGSVAAHAQTLSPLGFWTNADRQATFELYACGDRLCGRIATIRTPNDAAGRPLTDQHNPDPALRSRPRLGLVFVQRLRFVGNNQWEDGAIYDPENGKTYASLLRMLTPDRLEVRGYVGISLLGRSQIWTRVR